MSRTKRETSVDVNLVLLMNKGCFLYLCLLSSDDFLGFWLQIFSTSVFTGTGWESQPTLGSWVGIFSPAGVGVTRRCRPSSQFGSHSPASLKVVF